ncbi:hypothetical protein [Erythrobacter sp.]|jgi:hypothetical protein|nr:hypothetical protein [Erythrobacter sp.]
MSQQLTISSLASALALVCLCLVARAGSDGELRLGQDGIVMEADGGSSS